jgi:hypothetical protein
MKYWKDELKNRLQTVQLRALSYQLSRQEKILRAQRFLEAVVHPAMSAFADEIQRYRLDCTVSAPTNGEVKLIVHDQQKSPPMEVFHCKYKIQAAKSSVALEIYVSIEELPEPLAEIWLFDNYDPDDATAIVIEPLLRFFPTALLQLVANRDYNPNFNIG